MKLSADPKVQDFLNQIMMHDHDRHLIVEGLREIVFRHYPDVKERMMYGGIIFTQTDDFGGVFSYKNHVSFEFSNGFQLDDPEKLLEGSGKFRRHLKFKTVADIETKQAEQFIQEAKQA